MCLRGCLARGCDRRIVPRCNLAHRALGPDSRRNIRAQTQTAPEPIGWAARVRTHPQPLSRFARF